MSMVNRVQKRWTLEELHSLPDDGNKYELIRGELFVTPAPRVSHEFILARLTRVLDPYVAANHLGYVLRARAVITLEDDSEVEPDLMVRHLPEDREVGWEAVPLPILVIEVASDSTRRRDRVIKRGFYTDIQIPEYWMVDGADRTIRVVREERADVVATDTVTWHPAGVDTPLTIALMDIFGPNA